MKFGIRLAELVFQVTCRDCGKGFYLKIDSQDDILNLNKNEIISKMNGWSCDDHPNEDSLAELREQI